MSDYFRLIAKEAEFRLPFAVKLVGCAAYD